MSPRHVILNVKNCTKVIVVVKSFLKSFHRCLFCQTFANLLSEFLKL